MRPLAYTYPYALLFWSIYAWIFWPELLLLIRSMRRTAPSVSPDAGSLRAIMIGCSLAFVAAIELAWVPAFRWPTKDLRLALIVGLALAVAGSLLRRHCWRLLGKYFTFEVSVQANQPIVAVGAYAWVRHPSYTGGILSNTGLGIALGNWMSALVLLAVSVALYLYRIKVEERALLATIGDPYRTFCATRKRLIPGVY